MFLFFSVARSQEQGSWDRANETTHSSTTDKPSKSAAKNTVNPNFGMNMPMMSSAFDTSMWLTAA